VFYNAPDIYRTLAVFFEKTFNKDGGIPQADAKRAAQSAAALVKKNISSKSDFGA
jgi:hypothetical protein